MQDKVQTLSHMEGSSGDVVSNISEWGRLGGGWRPGVMTARTTRLQPRPQMRQKGPFKKCIFYLLGKEEIERVGGARPLLHSFTHKNSPPAAGDRALVHCDMCGQSGAPSPSPRKRRFKAKASLCRTPNLSLNFPPVAPALPASRPADNHCSQARGHQRNGNRCRRTHLRDADLQRRPLSCQARFLREPKALGPSHMSSGASLARAGAGGSRGQR